MDCNLNWYPRFYNHIIFVAQTLWAFLLHFNWLDSSFTNNISLSRGAIFVIMDVHNFIIIGISLKSPGFFLITYARLTIPDSRKHFKILILCCVPTLHFIILSHISRDKTMDYKLKYIPKNKQNYWTHVVRSRGSKGIRQWPINWCTSLMMSYKITNSVA